MVNACNQLGLSATDVVQAYLVDNNLPHKWRKELESKVKTMAGPHLALNPPGTESSNTTGATYVSPLELPIIVRWQPDQLDQMAR